MQRKIPKNGVNGAMVLATQIAAIRDECHRAVEVLSNADTLCEVKLAECVRLSDSLETANRFLKSAVAHVAIARRKIQRRG